MHTIARISLTALLAALAGTTIAQTTRTVGPNLTDFDHLTITAAIAASDGGDTILVEPDIYPENLAIPSGLAVTIENADPAAGQVIIFGQGLGRCLTLDTGANASVTLRDLVFDGGFNAANGGAIGMFTTNSAVIERCVIRNSFAGEDGGGIYASGTLVMTDTIIEGNESGIYAGGIYIGTSVADSTLTDVSIRDNSSNSGGGMAYVSPGERASFERVTFAENSAANWGGAVALLGTASVGEMRFDDSVFERNAAENGGAVWVSDQDVFRAVNSLFIGNTSSADGGAVYNEQIFDAVNCTFVGNDAGGIGDTFESERADADTNLLNCIVVNQDATSHSGPGELRPTFTLLPEGSAMPDADGNFNADPMFVDASNGDYRIMAGSPAIDAGNSYGLLGSVDVITLLEDFGGNVRNLDDADTPNSGVPAWNLNIDLGAYEFQPDAPASDCPADQNFDGVLSPADFNAWVLNFNAGCD